MATKKLRRRKNQILIRRLRFYGFALIPLIITIIFLKGDSGFINQMRLINKRNSLQKEIKELKQKRAQLEKEIKLLESDTQYIEKIAREEYGLGKPDEVIYIFKDEEKNFLP